MAFVVMQRDARVCQRQLSYLYTQVDYVIQFRLQQSYIRNGWSKCHRILYAGRIYQMLGFDDILWYYPQMGVRVR